MEANGLVTLITQLGFVPFVALWLLWHGQKQYAKLADRLSKVEDEQRGTLCKLLSETSSTLDRATRVIEKHERCVKGGDR